MSGRGRGRGRGRPPPSGARLLLQRSAQEAGLDAGNLRNLQDITKPQLFPDYEWHSNGMVGHEPPPSPTAPSSATAAKKKASLIYLISKSREMHHRFQEAPSYIRPSHEVDVVRYGKRPRPLEPDVNLAEHMGMTATSEYLPDELLPDERARTLAAKFGEFGEDGAPRQALSLDELAARELKRRKQAQEDGEEDGDLSDVVDIDEGEEEEVADYTQNYYESEDESDDGGGGGEATF